jgi:sialic acid synthase SpsE
MESIKPTPKTLIIAEVGVNHNGDLDSAKQLIREAALAGADIVKFQTFNVDLLVTENAPGASLKIYNKISTIPLNSVLQKKFYDLKGNPGP